MHFTNKFVHAQVIHSPTATVACSASSQEKALRETMEVTRDVAAASKIGRILGERLLIKYIPAVAIHMKKEQRYHGKVKAVIDSVREAGTESIHSGTRVDPCVSSSRTRLVELKSHEYSCLVRILSRLLLRAFRSIKEMMGRCSTKKVFLIQSPILFLHLLISFSSGAVKPDPRGVCVSKGGRFPPYESAGKPPNSVGRGSKDLTMCRVFRKRTCCSPAQTTPAFVAVRNLATHGEASQDCLHLFELLECSICNPDVGTQPGPPRICASFCDRVFDACKDAYFSSNALTQTIGPCGVNDDIICVKASNWESNGTSFCEAAGFAVQTNEDSREEPCYGSKASLESVVESWSRDSKKKTSFKTETLSCFKDLLQWVRVMTTIQKVSLGVSFLVAGMFLIRQWNNHKQKQRLAAIQRAARRLGGDANGDSYSAALTRRLVQS
ncbi:unnamed protein product [Brassica napus]|uniref:(rape) hypothetical protein n=1 Tax=Brassica napus TaxID=3708 RepID=A0A816NL35_BRANA|nr:unnamed protein product [Brassica napus]